jgi:PPK2 family polyphosphate:nucleotide phosphotransferase
VASEPDDEHDLIARARRVRQLLRTGSAGLKRLDPRATPGLPRKRPPDIDAKTWSRSEVGRLGQLLGARQERIFARAKADADRRRLLLVLQAVDCGGKDGTVRSVVGAMDPLGMHIKAFGPPTVEERSHHFLWRISRALPPAGYIGVFNRSHYEDVLAVRVKGLAPKSVWRRRYHEINAFEQALVNDGLTIVKVMLHISYEEQGERLLARLEDPTKRWKFNPSDLDDRDHWAGYQQAYGDVLNKCSAAAPWYVVPADRKWYRNWAVANLLLAYLDEMHLDYPDVDLAVDDLRARLMGDHARPDHARSDLGDHARARDTQTNTR